MGYSKKANAYHTDDKKTPQTNIPEPEPINILEPKLEPELEPKLEPEPNDIIEPIKIENKVKPVVKSNFNVSDSVILSKNKKVSQSYEGYEGYEDSYEEDEGFRKYVNGLNRKRSERVVEGEMITMSNIIDNLNKRLMYLEYKNDVSYESEQNKYMNYDGILEMMRDMGK